MARKKKLAEATEKQKRMIKARLEKKYPQMYVTKATKREKKVISRATPEDRKELERMIGKKLKKIYRSK